MRLVIVDDHPLFREGVALTLANEPDVTVVGEGASAEDATHLARSLLPDILLLDLDIPGGGLSVLQSISAMSPATRVVILTAATNEEYLLAALGTGAKGYVLKGVGVRELANITRAVHDGQSYVTPELAAHVLSGRFGPVQALPQVSQLDKLTERERQILDLLANGSSNSQIAQQLNLSEQTVKNTMTCVMRKLQVHNRVEAAVLANRAAAQSA